jgi:hypothetical protein
VPLQDWFGTDLKIRRIGHYWTQLEYVLDVSACVCVGGGGGAVGMSVGVWGVCVLEGGGAVVLLERRPMLGGGQMRRGLFACMLPETLNKPQTKPPRCWLSLVDRVTVVSQFTQWR